MTQAYREWAPPPDLATRVEAIWALSGDGPAPPDPERVLPDGCAELILNFADPVEHYPAPGRGVRQPRVMFVGQIDGPFHIRPTGRLDLLGVRFRPGGARAWIPVPQHELVGLGLPLGFLAPRLSRALDGPACDAPDPAARVAGIVTALREEHRHLGPTPVDQAVRLLLDQWGAVSVDAVAAAAGLSPRQLDRRFLDQVGLRPKLLARICRFQRVFHALERGSGSWTRVAVECGYYDASHLIRDFRAFAGDAPARLLAEAPELTRVFTRAARGVLSSGPISL